jgi:hypothetical protein
VREGTCGRPKHGCEDNIKLYLKKGFEYMDRGHLVQDEWSALVNVVMKPWVL